ncbi:DUF3883 domain-containing protein [Falsiroseomonas sp. HC035]|uniref:DUF3883 domain-containing protein n=1 Tax=Falsiroseomonas sp. HC035 TaxID=3390999 RepID=UPI003D30EFB4
MSVEENSLASDDPPSVRSSAWIWEALASRGISRDAWTWEQWARAQTDLDVYKAPHKPGELGLLLRRGKAAGLKLSAMADVLQIPLAKAQQYLTESDRNDPFETDFIILRMGASSSSAKDAELRKAQLGLSRRIQSVTRVSEPPSGSWSQDELSAAVSSYHEAMISISKEIAAATIKVRRKTHRSYTDVAEVFRGISWALQSAGLEWLPEYQPNKHGQSDALEMSLNNLLAAQGKGAFTLKNTHTSQENGSVNQGKQENNEANPVDGQRGSDWTRHEVEACVEAYLEMLDLEIAGTPYSKIAFNRRVQAATGRSKGSVEFKFGNVTAVMDRLGFRWIQGYKPAPNAQTGAIQDAVMRLLGTRAQLAARLEVPASSGSPAASPGTGSDVFADAPPRSPPSGAKAQLPPGSNVRKFDRELTDAKNRELGRAGEEFVLKFEMARLVAAGCKDLADKVFWVADEQGDGAGYDIASFSVDGTQRLIEVKTTNGSASTSFLVTANEVEVSRANPDTYWLYRVYNLSNEPRVYCVKGPLDDGWDLEPAVFRAKR